MYNETTTKKSLVNNKENPVDFMWTNKHIIMVSIFNYSALVLISFYLHNSFKDLIEIF